MSKPETTQEAVQNLRTAGANLLFELGKAVGVIWLISKIPFLDYKDWVKRRLEK